MAIYIGPDQVMPVGSFLGTLFGLILIFWNKLILLLSRITGRPLARTGGKAPSANAGRAAGAEETQQH